VKHVSEYRDARLVKGALEEIRRVVTKPWVVMEICGGQTHAIVRHGLDRLLPSEINLVHGPGCPVCVTPLEQIDRALAIASLPEVIFTSYGDMLRVPGSGADLFSANAMSVLQAESLGLRNFSVLVSQVCVPPAMRAILGSPDNRVQAFLAAGHVCAVMGYWEYGPIAEEYRVPIVVTGFEPLDLAQGILATVRQLESGRFVAENAYPRAVTLEGNRPAQEVIRRVFMACDRKWRGIGLIPMSGLGLRPAFETFDAEKRFDVGQIQPEESPVCISGQILTGLKKPEHCPAFGTSCTPEHPLGATMVSSEGACAAYYRYRHIVEPAAATHGSE
jgi:hydrogenase expression/formation protein HypD